MSLTDQPAAYRDCYLLFEMAVSSGKRPRVPFPTKSAALYFQMRMNQSRVILRNESRRAYPSDHPLYDKSEFDGYQVVVRPDDSGEWWVLVQPTGINLDYIELLDDDNNIEVATEPSDKVPQ